MCDIPVILILVLQPVIFALVLGLAIYLALRGIADRIIGGIQAGMVKILGDSN